MERTTTTRTAKDGTTTTTVRERYTPPDWRADGWFLERRHPADWSRRTELVILTPLRITAHIGRGSGRGSDGSYMIGVAEGLKLAGVRRGDIHQLDLVKHPMRPVVEPTE